MKDSNRRGFEVPEQESEKKIYVGCSYKLITTHEAYVVEKILSEKALPLTLRDRNGNIIHALPDATYVYDVLCTDGTVLKEASIWGFKDGKPYIQYRNFLPDGRSSIG